MALPAVLLKAKNKLLKNGASSSASAGDELASKVASASTKMVVLPVAIMGFAAFLVVILLFQKFQIFQGVDTAYADTGGGASSMNADSYLEWAVNIANDDSHGYSQCNRTGPDYDCSSLVWYSLVNAGGFTKEQLGGYAFATGSMTSVLKKAGFKKYSYTGADALQPGDILLRKGHTEIYYGEGKTVGAHIAETGGRCGKAGDSTKHEIDVGNMSHNWSSYFRLEG